MLHWTNSLGIVNPIMFGIGVLQIVAGIYGLWFGAPKAGGISILVGVSNMILATVKA